jgi:hypothetical protein
MFNTSLPGLMNQSTFTTHRMSNAFFAVLKKTFGGFDESGKPARAACLARDEKEVDDDTSKNLSPTFL